jgi:putative toxin-antitoxin system antitoxin component (TIGR02293 family)
MKLMPKARKRTGIGRSGALRRGDGHLVSGKSLLSEALPKNQTDPEQVMRTIARATEVLGDQDAAFRWLGTPVPALDYATPIAFLGRPQGVTRVHDVLTQMEHGVW